MARVAGRVARIAHAAFARFVSDGARITGRLMITGVVVVVFFGGKTRVCAPTRSRHFRSLRRPGDTLPLDRPSVRPPVQRAPKITSLPVFFGCSVAFAVRHSAVPVVRAVAVRFVGYCVRTTYNAVKPSPQPFCPMHFAIGARATRYLPVAGEFFRSRPPNFECHGNDGAAQKKKNSEASARVGGSHPRGNHQLNAISLRSVRLNRMT